MFPQFPFDNNLKRLIANLSLINYQTLLFFIIFPQKLSEKFETCRKISSKYAQKP